VGEHPTVEQSSKRIEGLDGLRAVAVSLVILWHVAIELRFSPAMLGPFRHLAFMGWAGVDLFFVISGYLITSLMLREESTNAERRVSLPRFYARRALRILPLFAVAMALNYAVLWRSPVFRSTGVGNALAAGDWTRLAAYPLFLGNYYGAYGWHLHGPRVDLGSAVSVTWSLCVEEHFYLIWPLLFRALPRARLAVCLAVCLAAPMVRHLVSAQRLDTVVALHIASHYRMDSILWGCALALVALRPPRRRPAALRAGIAVTAALVAWLAATGDLSLVPRGTSLGHGLGLTLLALLAALVVAEIVTAQRSAFVRALEWRPLRDLGVLSYGVYLVHLWAIDLTRQVLIAGTIPPTPLTFACACLLTLGLSAALASVLHRLVERPFLRLKHRYAA
jgi:peptidoglycan/LPS O-acetylase OafA/YrhL